MILNLVCFYKNKASWHCDPLRGIVISLIFIFVCMKKFSFILNTSSKQTFASLVVFLFIDFWIMGPLETLCLVPTAYPTMPLRLDIPAGESFYLS